MAYAPVDSPLGGRPPTSSRSFRLDDILPARKTTPTARNMTARIASSIHCAISSPLISAFAHPTDRY